MSFQLTKVVDMDEKRCWNCGTMWAVERIRTNRADCPGCASDKVEERSAEEKRLGRVIRSLRGAITRMKAVRA